MGPTGEHREDERRWARRQKESFKGPGAKKLDSIRLSVERLGLERPCVNGPGAERLNIERPSVERPGAEGPGTVQLKII